MGLWSVDELHLFPLFSPSLSSRCSPYLLLCYPPLPSISLTLNGLFLLTLSSSSTSSTSSSPWWSLSCIYLTSLDGPPPYPIPSLPAPFLSFPQVAPVLLLLCCPFAPLIPSHLPLHPSLQLLHPSLQLLHPVLSASQSVSWSVSQSVSQSSGTLLACVAPGAVADWLFHITSH